MIVPDGLKTIPELIAFLGDSLLIISWFHTLFLYFDNELLTLQFYSKYNKFSEKIKAQILESSFIDHSTSYIMSKNFKRFNIIN
jgi:hypothetical protein